MARLRGATSLWVALLIVAILSVVSLVRSISQATTSADGGPHSGTFDRIQRNGELRVAYFVMPPYLMKSTQSQEISGIFYDVAEEMGKRLGLRIVWVEEASLSTLSAGFDSGRYDIIVFPLWRSASRADSVAFSTPLFYTTVGAYVREGNTRFDNDMSSINSPDVTIAGIDGELAVAIAAEDFPKAAVSSLPNLTDYSQMLLDVATGKADVTFYNRVQGRRFMQQNPSRIRELPLSRPIRVYAECLVLPLGDVRLQNMINATLAEMIENGAIEDAFTRSGENVEDYFFPAQPYRIDS